MHRLVLDSTLMFIRGTVNILSQRSQVKQKWVETLHHHTARVVAFGKLKVQRTSRGCVALFHRLPISCALPPTPVDGPNPLEREARSPAVEIGSLARTDLAHLDAGC